MNANEWSTKVTTFAEEGLQAAVKDFEDRVKATEETGFTKETLLNMRDDMVEWIVAIQDLSGDDSGFLDSYLDKFYEMRDDLNGQITELDECEWLNNQEAEQ